MAKVSPEQRFWFASVSLMLGKLSKKRASLMQESEYHLIKRLYERCGGSWVALADGDSQAWSNLRLCCKSYFKVCKAEKKGPYSEGLDG